MYIDLGCLLLLHAHVLVWLFTIFTPRTLLQFVVPKESGSKYTYKKLRDTQNVCTPKNYRSSILSGDITSRTTYGFVISARLPPLEFSGDGLEERRTEQKTFSPIIRS